MRVGRSILVILAAGAVVAWSGLCHAAGPGAAVLRSADLPPYLDVIEGFEETCDCKTESLLHSGDDPDAVAASVATGSYDALFAVGIDALHTARATRGAPLLAALVPCAEPRPKSGAAATIVQMIISPADQAFALASLFPGRRRVGVLYDQRHMGSYVAALGEEAGRLGMEIVPGEVSAPGEVPRRLDGMKGRIDVLLLLPDPTVISAESLQYLFLTSFERRVPVFAFSPKYLARGAVAAVRIDPRDVGKQAGRLFVQRAVGGRDGDLCLYADTWRLSVNEKVAAKLKVKLAPAGDIRRGPPEEER